MYVASESVYIGRVKIHGRRHPHPLWAASHPHLSRLRGPDGSTTAIKGVCVNGHRTVALHGDARASLHLNGRWVSVILDVPQKRVNLVREWPSLPTNSKRRMDHERRLNE